MISFVFTISGIFSMALSAPVNYYNTKYEHINIEMILNNRRMVSYYAACLLHKGPCPPEGLEFKTILPEALKTNCARCTDKQKTYTLRVIKRLKKEYPKIWMQLQEQWDPDNIYVSKFEETFENYTPKQTTQSTTIIKIGDRYGDDNINNSVESSTSSSIIVKTNSSQTFTTSSDIKDRFSSETTTKSTTVITTTKPPSNSFVRPSLGAGIQATMKNLRFIEDTMYELAKAKVKKIWRLKKFIFSLG